MFLSKSNYIDTVNIGMKKCDFMLKEAGYDPRGYHVAKSQSDRDCGTAIREESSEERPKSYIM